MDKILIVEDDKVIAKVLEKKSRAAGYSPFVALTRQNALELIKSHDFFAALLDLNLPDAQNGEVVDDVLAKNIPAIVLTALYDDDTRIRVSAKQIVDYVIKNREESIDYAIATIARIKRYQHSRALVVEDSAPQRLFVKKMLEAMRFQVHEAEDGIQALEIIKQHPDIHLVVTDYNMPNMDGLELMLQLRKQHKEDDMAIIALTGYDSKDLASKFLKFGASDYLPKPFTREEFVYRINRKMDVLKLIADVKEHTEQLEMANESIRHANEAKLRYIERIEEYLDIIDKNVLLSKTDEEGVITYVSNAFCQLSGYNLSELVGKTHAVLRHPDLDDRFFQGLWDTIKSGQEWAKDMPNQAKNGETFWVRTRIMPLLDEHKVRTGYIAIRENITDKIRAEQMIFSDPLTGTLNRTKIEELIRLEVDRAQRYNEMFSMICVEVDEFSKLVERHGYTVGDTVLSEIARLIQHEIRTTDSISRWDQAKFMLLLPKSEIGGAKILASRIHHAVNQIMLAGRPMNVSASLGVAEYIPDDTFDVMIDRTQMLLYKAKESGANQVCYQENTLS